MALNLLCIFSLLQSKSLPGALGIKAIGVVDALEGKVSVLPSRPLVS